jgi:glycosyltransferase involved in cell wall biosynthesis
LPGLSTGNNRHITAFVRATRKHGISPVNYYRAALPITALSEESSRYRSRVLSQTEVSKLIKKSTSKFLLGSDIYVLSRLYRREGLGRFVDTLHKHNAKIVFDTDDDLTEEFRDIDGRGGEFIHTMKHMDLVTVSTPFLAKRIAKFIGYEPPVLVNHIDFRWFSRYSAEAERTAEGLTIGLIGTASHYNDWYFPLEAMAEIATEHPWVTLVVAGYYPDYLKGLPNIVELKAVPYGAYPGLMRQFDIVCCSLDPNDTFNQSKSSIKALEAMAAARTLPNGKVGGAVPVCTNMPVYRRTVNNRQNGLLTDNNDWYAPLKQLVTDTPLRHKLSVAGHKWVKKNRDIRTGWRHWAKAYDDLMEGKHDR